MVSAFLTPETKTGPVSVTTATLGILQAPRCFGALEQFILRGHFRFGIVFFGYKCVKSSVGFGKFGKALRCSSECSGGVRGVSEVCVLGKKNHRKLFI